MNSKKYIKFLLCITTISINPREQNRHYKIDNSKKCHQEETKQKKCNKKKECKKYKKCRKRRNTLECKTCHKPCHC